MRTRNEIQARLQALREAAPRAMQGAGSVFAQWGPECGEGWHPIIIEALQRIHALLSDEEAARFHINQIKQKWGELRIYWTLVRAEDEAEPQKLTRIRETVVGINLSQDWQDARRAAIQAIVATARVKANSTCEQCGAPGVLHPVGHVQVLCAEHIKPAQAIAAERLKEREAMLARRKAKHKLRGDVD
jgi:hypothetical protein